jgi:phosphotransferase system enzyme I (PtsP)
MVLAEMTELGAFTGEGAALRERHTAQAMFRGGCAQEGTAMGHVWLHEPRVVVTRPVADDPDVELKRLHDAVERLRVDVDQMLTRVAPGDAEQREVLEAYRMFARSRGWMRRMEEDIARGLSAEAAVEKEQSTARARMETVPDAYLRDRLHDLDDLSNRLLRLLTGQGQDTGADMPPDPILVARNIGPAELLDYGRRLKGVVLEEGSVGSHAAIVARALAIPLVIHAARITTEALNGDFILVDGDQGIVHLRPEDTGRLGLPRQARHAGGGAGALRLDPRQAGGGAVRDGGVAADERRAHGRPAVAALLGGGGRGPLPHRAAVPDPQQGAAAGELAALYARVMDAAGGKKVVFRTLDIGSDKVLPYMKPQDEPNPALGWRAIRVGLDKPGVMRMQLQALIRAAAGRPLAVMFPFVAQLDEFTQARDHLLRELDREAALGHVLPEKTEIGAMLETPSMAFAPRRFYETGRFHLDRRQRPEAVLLRRRPRERACAAALRHAERVVPLADRADRGALRGHRHAAELLRRGCGATDRGGVLRGDGAPDPVDAPGVDRAGEIAPASCEPRRGAGGYRRGARIGGAVGAARGDGLAAAKFLGNDRAGIGSRARRRTGGSPARSRAVVSGAATVCPGRDAAGPPRPSGSGSFEHITQKT